MNEKFNKPIKVQLAFQGGGAKIFALIAAAKAIKQIEQSKKIIVTRVAGSSAGSIVAAMYATGVNPDEMRKNFSTLPDEYRNIIPTSKNKILKFFHNLIFYPKSVIRIWLGKPIIDEKILYSKLEEIPELENTKIGDEKNINLIITKTDLTRHENVISPIGNKIINEIVESHFS